METVEEIKQHLGPGDYSRIGKRVGISRKYARVLLDRPTASLFPMVLQAAKEVAEFNANLTVK